MNGQPVATLKKAGPLQRTTTPITLTDAATGLEVKIPGNTKISELTLERGLTSDEEFIKWADLVYSSQDTHEKEGFKRDLILEVLNNRGQVVQRYFLNNCWVSEFATIPELDAEANAIAIERVKVVFEGYTRDPSLKV